MIVKDSYSCDICKCDAKVKYSWKSIEYICCDDPVEISLDICKACITKAYLAICKEENGDVE